MNTLDQSDSENDFLLKLLDVMERIAHTGDLQSVPPLLEMTIAGPQSPLISSLAEAFAKMVVRLEAREFQLECTIDELMSIKSELELANYDPLTGLPNRVIASDRLRQSVSEARHSSSMVAILYLDLDHFKEVNDVMGHPAGDELLQLAARRIRECVRKADTVARLGGDEFLCIMTELEGAATAHELANRIVTALAHPFDLNAGQVSIGVSIGISLFPYHGETSDQLISCADKAMYKAKHDGRNGYFACTEQTVT